MAEFTPEQEKEFEFRLRYEQEQAAKQPKQEAAASDSVVASTNEVMLPAAGAVAGAAVRNLPTKIVNGMVQDPVTGKWMAVENYARQMAQGKYYGGNNYNQVWDKIREVNADPTRGPILEKEAMANRTAGQKLVSKVPKPLQGALTSPMGMLGRGVVGLGAGMQGADALNRWNAGDTSGAIISGLGAVGTAAAMAPHPIARVGGTAIGMGAEALNSYLDSLKNKNKPQGMKGGGRTLSPEVSFSANSFPELPPEARNMPMPQGAMARMQMSQPIGDGHLRAGVSGMGMAIPGQQGVKLMPGQMDVGYSVPVGPGHLDISGQRAINRPMPGKQQPYRADIKYSIPFAQGGLAYIK